VDKGGQVWRYPARRGVRTLGSWPKIVVALPDRPVALFGCACGWMALSGATLPFLVLAVEAAGVARA
jgi:hypothetical protein